MKQVWTLKYCSSQSYKLSKWRSFLFLRSSFRRIVLYGTILENIKLISNCFFWIQIIYFSFTNECWLLATICNQSDTSVINIDWVMPFFNQKSWWFARRPVHGHARSPPPTWHLVQNCYVRCQGWNVTPGWHGKNWVRTKTIFPKNVSTSKIRNKIRTDRTDFSMLPIKRSVSRLSADIYIYRACT